MNSQDSLYKALKEVSVVLEYTNPKLRSKVPENFIWFMENFKDDSYEFYIDLHKPLEEQNLRYESIVILSIILKSAWCDKKTLNRLKKNYQIDKKNFMRDRKVEKDRINEEIRSLTIPKKKNIFSRIFDGLKSLFGRQKKRIYYGDDFNY